MKTEVVDLFCGAGGTSTGILKALERLGRSGRVTAVNHWRTAVNSHSLNHPGVRHLCANVENVHPMEVVKSGRLDLLAASCECRFFSNARGGGPCNEQSRSQAWQLIRWATDIRVDSMLMENVREFLSWGPINSRTKRPIKSRKGEFFRGFINALSGLGYSVEWKLQVAADFGDPTTRTRFILIAHRQGKAIRWPEPTHGPGRPSAYRTARECIDWELTGKSIFNRKRPLCENTLRRIAAGLQKFGGSGAELFLILLRGMSDRHIEQSSPRPLDEPLPTLTAGGGHLMLCEPFTIQIDQPGGNACYARPVDRPLASVVRKQNMLLVEPMILKYYKTGRCKSVEQPLDTVTTKARFMLVECEGRTMQLDIRTRMLQPHELSQAHSFPKSYRFTGTIEDQIKQIGNSVPVELAAAHAEATLS